MSRNENNSDSTTNPLNQWNSQWYDDYLLRNGTEAEHEARTQHAVDPQAQQVNVPFEWSGRGWASPPSRPQTVQWSGTIPEQFSPGVSYDVETGQAQADSIPYSVLHRLVNASRRTVSSDTILGDDILTKKARKRAKKAEVECADDGSYEDNRD